MTPDKTKGGWVEYLRFLTPILLTIALFMLGTIQTRLEDIDEKLFRHLTNDEIHTPKSMVVTRAEYQIYQNLRQIQMDDLKIMVVDIRTDNNSAHAAIMAKLMKMK